MVKKILVRKIVQLFGATAVKTGHRWEVAKYLIEKGADIFAKNEYEKTPLEVLNWELDPQLFVYLTNLKKQA